MNPDIEPFDPKHRLLLVSIAKTIGERGSVYDATRYAWRVSRERVEKIDYVLGCVNGVVKGVFQVGEWLDASPGEPTMKNFPGMVARHRNQRWGFEGSEPDEAITRIYLEKRVPDHLEIGQNGFRYYDHSL